MKRNMLLEEPTNDFSLRLDLIDHFPELFQKNDQKAKKLKLTTKEIQQLRILMIEQQENKMYM